jgi:tetratricopeptide (TPR) repeat protein
MVFALLIVLVTSAIAYAGVPTIPSVADTKRLAMEYYEQNDWMNAVERLSLWETEAHMIATLTLAATKPGASPTALRELPTPQLAVMADYSELSQKYSKERNEAVFLQAQCYYNLGEHKQATECLERLFELVSYRQWELWTEGRKLLGVILGLGIE